ncbi:MAG: alpha/beta fold hydrolase, partial [Chloroflexia bacterium]
LSRLVAGPRAQIALWMRALKRVSAAWSEMYDEILEDTEKLDYAAVQQSLECILSLDLRPKLGQLYTHTLVVYGDRDEFVDPEQAGFFADGTVATAQVVLLEGCRHFPFLDEPSKFNRLLKEFLASQLGQILTVKEEWKRRYRQVEYL